MIQKTTVTHWATIFIAGDYDLAKWVCSTYCDSVGLCVTVEPTIYIYSGGAEKGVRVGLINYPRFPKSPEEVNEQALELAKSLRGYLDQQSFSIMTPNETNWYSWRQEDNPA